MKKRALKIISSLFAALFLFSFPACNKPAEPGAGGGEKTEVENANHIFKMEDTNEYLVQNNATRYKLVVPATETKWMTTARNEFVALFKDCTGADIQAVSDTGLTHSAENLYISLGDTALYETSGLTVDKTALSAQGLRIITKDKTVYIVGGSDQGVLYGVYTFMEQNFNFDTYTATVRSYDRVNDFPLKKYDITDIPDIKSRSNSTQSLSLSSTDYDEDNYGNRMRFSSSGLIPVFKDYDVTSEQKWGVHNTASHVLPITTWYETHPKWFSDSSEKTNGLESQLCYTAHGDEAEYEAMILEAVKKMQFSIENCSDSLWKNQRGIAFGINDNRHFCTCKDCLSATEKYGSPSGAAIVMQNEIAERLQEWMKSLPDDHPRKDENIKVYFTAYYQFSVAPAKYDAAADKYVPTSEEVKLRDNVVCYLCYIDINYQKSMFDEANKNIIEQSLAWKSCGNNLEYYVYNNNYQYQQYFYDSFSFYTAEMYRFIAEINPGYFYILGQSRMPCRPTAWNNLKIYLDSKLSWNSSLDYDALVDKWFKGVYKDVWQIMKEQFIATRTHYMSTFTASGMNGNGFTGHNRVENKKYWQLPVLNEWINTYDSAIKAAEKYKEADYATYKRICDHIELECLSPLIIKATLYYNEISETEKAALRNRLQADIDTLAVGEMRFSEAGNGITLNAFVNSL